MRALLWNLFFHNFFYKILSVLLAILLWAIIQGEQIQDKNVEIAVNVHLAPGYSVRGKTNTRIKAATVRGPRVWMLESPSRLEGDIYIPSGQTGQLRIRLTKHNLRGFNDRLQLMVHDPYVDLFVDKEMEKIVPIKEVQQGTPEDGYIIEKVNIEPKMVTIKGIKNDLTKIRNISTEPIDVSGIKENKSYEIRLNPPSGISREDLSSDKVRVSFQVGVSKVNKRFGSIPIEVTSTDFRADVSPSYISVLVQGTPSELNFIKRENFIAYVDARGLEPGRYELDVKVKIPAGIVLIETFPEKINVEVKNSRKSSILNR